MAALEDPNPQVQARAGKELASDAELAKHIPTLAVAKIREVLSREKGYSTSLIFVTLYCFSFVIIGRLPQSMPEVLQSNPNYSLGFASKFVNLKKIEKKAFLSRESASWKKLTKIFFLLCASCVGKIQQHRIKLFPINTN